jgi:peptidoglycan/xylan/chitin deacetylase (PgdA/CDA1 family)
MSKLAHRVICSLKSENGKHLLKRTVMRVLYSLCVFTLFRFSNRRKLLILTYHGVLNDASTTDEYVDRNFVSAASFESQMSYLSRHYNVITLTELVDILNKKHPMGTYNAVVTFDDGYKNNYTVAYPIMKQCGIRPTIFLATGFMENGKRLPWTEKVRRAIYFTQLPYIRISAAGLDRLFPTSSATQREQTSREIVEALKSMPDEARQDAVDQLLKRIAPNPEVPWRNEERDEFLNWDDVAEMSRNGIEFGSHTVNHAILPRLTEQDVLNEICLSKKEIQDVQCKECTLFSYPNGSQRDFTQDNRACLQQAGYTCALTQIPGFNTNRTDVFELKRFNIGRGHDFPTFVATISGSLIFFKRLIRK